MKNGRFIRTRSIRNSVENSIYASQSLLRVGNLEQISRPPTYTPARLTNPSPCCERAIRSRKPARRTARRIHLDGVGIAPSQILEASYNRAAACSLSPGIIRGRANARWAAVCRGSGPLNWMRLVQAGPSTRAVRQEAPRNGHLSSLPAWSARSVDGAAAPIELNGIGRPPSGLQRFGRSGSVGCRCLRRQDRSRGGLNARAICNVIISSLVGREALRHSRKLLLIFRVHQISLRDAFVVIANEGGLSGFGEFGKLAGLLAIPLCGH
jgi:hypothetical protein